MTEHESIPINDEFDITIIRERIYRLAMEAGFGLVDRTKLATAASEMLRNIVEYAGYGTTLIEVIAETTKEGLRITFMDEGPGIADVELAMQDGFSTRGGLGMGLPGAKRLVDGFELISALGKGTTVVLVKWKIP